MSAAPPAADRALLRVQDLGVTTTRGARTLLQGATFAVERGQAVGIVGPSGAGKSTLALALVRLLPRGAQVADGSAIHLGTDQLHLLDEPAMRAVRGARIGYVFQEPLLALDPAMRVGEQVAEAALVHGAAPREARDRALTLLGQVGFTDPRAIAARHPHELSGGQRQRVCIAAAMLMEPELLIADEPTTALDPTLQAQVLDLIDALRTRTGTALLLISHDLRTVAERCERVLVVGDGRLLEDRPAAESLAAYRGRRPSPAFGTHVVPAPDAARAPLLRVRGLEVTYPATGLAPFSRAPRAVTAVAGLDLDIARGDVVALVGESGCGKSSTAHAILRLVEPSAGTITFDGVDVRALGREPLRALRKRMQLVPQDAGASLTPHLTCGAIVAEGFEVHGLAQGAEALDRARVLLRELGLPARAADALPRELSSGERQRVAIARALAPDPDLLVCDEPLASVDEVARGHVLAVLAARRAERGLALLLISHDLEAERRLASRVVVMYFGRVVEESGGTAALAAPRMPYTQALVAAIPTGDPGARRGRLPLAADAVAVAGAGCAFHSRCPHPAKDEQCRTVRPTLQPAAQDPMAHRAACWHATLPPEP